MQAPLSTDALPSQVIPSAAIVGPVVIEDGDLLVPIGRIGGEYVPAGRFATNTTWIVLSLAGTSVALVSTDALTAMVRRATPADSTVNTARIPLSWLRDADCHLNELPSLDEARGFAPSAA